MGGLFCVLSKPAWPKEVLELRTEVQRLQRENLEQRQQVGYWKSRHRDALKRIAALEKNP